MYFPKIESVTRVFSELYGVVSRALSAICSRVSDVASRILGPSANQITGQNLSEIATTLRHRATLKQLAEQARAVVLAKQAAPTTPAILEPSVGSVDPQADVATDSLAMVVYRGNPQKAISDSAVAFRHLILAAGAASLPKTVLSVKPVELRVPAAVFNALSNTSPTTSITQPAGGASPATGSLAMVVYTGNP